MSMMTVKSDEARTRMRDILDEAVAGREVVIQRYAKPVAVVVPYELWKALKVADAFTEAKQIPAKIKRSESEWVSNDEVVRAVLAKRHERVTREQAGNVDAEL